MELTVHCDSKLVVEQCSGRWNCSDQRLGEFRNSIWQLIKHFKRVSFEWIPRAENAEADAQSRVLYV